MSSVCHVQVLLCLVFVMSRVCYIQFLLCLGFVMSSVFQVQGLLCLAFVCLEFVMFSVCLSRVGYGTLMNTQTQKIIFINEISTLAATFKLMLDVDSPRALYALHTYSPLSLATSFPMSRATQPKSQTVWILEACCSALPLCRNSIFRLGSCRGSTWEIRDDQ